MKKISALLSVLLLVCCLINGCSDSGKGAASSNSFSLAETPVASEKFFELSSADTISIHYDIPEAGYMKMIAYDSTEYYNWPDEIAEIYVDFKDESGKILYEKVRITDGYVEKYLFDAGKLTAEISVENQPAKMERIALSWAFAAENYEPVDVAYGTNAAATADENGVARFSFSVDKPSLVRISPSEACIYESDCSFYVETAEGEKVTGDLSIHGTEWSSRLVFLTKGEYTVVVSGIDAVAACSVREEKAYSDIHLGGEDGLSVPVTFGFNPLNAGERKASFTADGSKKYLAVETRGEGTFYDSVHYVDVVITDAEGNIVAQRDEEDAVSDETRLDISALRGEYTVTVSSNGSCVAEIFLVNE